MAIKISGLRGEGAETAISIGGGRWSATAICRACDYTQTAAGTGKVEVKARCPRCGSDKIELRDVSVAGSP